MEVLIKKYLYAEFWEFIGLTPEQGSCFERLVKEKFGEEMPFIHQHIINAVQFSQLNGVIILQALKGYQFKGLSGQLGFYHWLNLLALTRHPSESVRDYIKPLALAVLEPLV